MKNYRCYAYYVQGIDAVYDYQYIRNHFEIDPEQSTAKCMKNFGYDFKAGQIYKVILTKKGYEILL